jgi:hypothetical protein
MHEKMNFSAIKNLSKYRKFQTTICAHINSLNDQKYSSIYYAATILIDQEERLNALQLVEKEIQYYDYRLTDNTHQ